MRVGAVIERSASPAAGADVTRSDSGDGTVRRRLGTPGSSGCSRSPSHSGPSVAGAVVWNDHGALGSMSLPLWLLAALFYAGEVCLVDLHFRRGAFSFSMNEVPLVLGLFFASPRELLIALGDWQRRGVCVPAPAEHLEGHVQRGQLRHQLRPSRSSFTRWLLPRPVGHGSARLADRRHRDRDRGHAWAASRYRWRSRCRNAMST